MGGGELAVSNKEGWIAGNGLIQQISRLQKILPVSGVEAERQHKTGGTTVEIEGRYIRRWRVFDRLLLVRRKLRPKLIGDRLRDLTLNGENIREIAIVSLRPEMRVGPRRQ